MRKIENWESVREAGSLSLKAGAYPCKIINVTDVPENNYLTVEFDIAKGPEKDYFHILSQTNGGIWRGKANRFYSDKALPFFKGFITAIEKTNKGYTWNWDEKSLVGKYVVVVFREEESVNKNNEIAVAVVPYEFRSADALKEGKIEIPAKKCLTEEELREKGIGVDISNDPVEAPIDDDDLPF